MRLLPLAAAAFLLAASRTPRGPVDQALGSAIVFAQAKDSAEVVGHSSLSRTLREPRDSRARKR